MRHTRPARSTKVQHLRARRNKDLTHPAPKSRRQLAPERVPHAVLDFRAVDAAVDGYALLAVDGLAGDEVLGDEHLLFALCDEDACMPVRLDDHVRPTPCTSSSASGSSPTSWSSGTSTPPSGPASACTSTAKAACEVQIFC